MTTHEIMGGQILIYRDLAWQHRAYVSSGIDAIYYVGESDDLPANGGTAGSSVDINAWELLDKGVRDEVFRSVKDSSLLLVEREQLHIIEPMWADLDANRQWFIGTMSQKAKNPVDPDNSPFLTVVPGGSVRNYADRSSFAFDGAHGVFPVWWGDASLATSGLLTTTTRVNLVKIPLTTRGPLFQ